MTAATPPAGDVPPEAALIRERRETTPPYWSIRQLAIAVGMSPSGLSKVESGEYQAKPDKLAALAEKLGITADELEDIGRRHDRQNALRAAALLREAPASADEPVLAAVAGSMPESVLRAVLEGIEEIRATPGLSRREREALEAELVRGTLAYVSAHVGQIRASHPGR